MLYLITFCDSLICSLSLLRRHFIVPKRNMSLCRKLLGLLLCTNSLQEIVRSMALYSGQEIVRSILPQQTLCRKLFGLLRRSKHFAGNCLVYCAVASSVQEIVRSISPLKTVCRKLLGPLRRSKQSFTGYHQSLQANSSTHQAHGCVQTRY